MSSMFYGIVSRSKLLSEVWKMRERNSRTGKAYLGGTEEVIVIGIRDGAILIGGRKATIIEEGE